MSATETTTATNPKWDAERKNHGPISAVQLIGHLGSDATFHPAEQRPDGSMSKPRISGRIAVSRGQDYDSSWFSFNIYGGTNAANDESSRPTDEQLQALAAQLTKSQRVKLQGLMEFLQTSKDNYEAACAAAGIEPGSEQAQKTPWLRSLFFSGTARLTMFVSADQSIAPLDTDGRRPVTLLSPIGDSTGGRSDLPY